ncbi:hypothetical protein [Fangia hongkongensis]|uniref:hypothetical protein n=1 Tax=Fangia hongkongensis TaxID=270495 RepID=UPI00037D7413|nr:hypothetical protein [Fangia hongkongensis]MBK2124723.1 hypothetical protein [Fangia hongkongensis]
MKLIKRLKLCVALGALVGGASYAYATQNSSTSVVQETKASITVLMPAYCASSESKMYVKYKNHGGVEAESQFSYISQKLTNYIINNADISYLQLLCASPKPQNYPLVHLTIAKNLINSTSKRAHLGTLGLIVKKPMQALSPNQSKAALLSVMWDKGKLKVVDRKTKKPAFSFAGLNCRATTTQSSNNVLIKCKY